MTKYWTYWWNIWQLLKLTHIWNNIYANLFVIRLFGIIKTTHFFLTRYSHKARYYYVVTKNKRKYTNMKIFLRTIIKLKKAVGYL